MTNRRETCTIRRMSKANPTLQERLAGLTPADRALIAERASVTSRTLLNIVNGSHSPHAGTVKSIERVLARFKPAKKGV